MFYTSESTSMTNVYRLYTFIYNYISTNYTNYINFWINYIYDCL